MRDSAGFAPDFAAFAPAGDMCPATRAYAITTTRPRAHGEPADAQRRAAGSLAGAAGAIRARQRSGVVQADVIGTLVTLSEREAEELRAAAAAEAGRSSARRDLALLLERALRRRTTVALSRAEARELAELVTTGGFAANVALLEEALRRALEDGPE